MPVTGSRSTRASALAAIVCATLFAGVPVASASAQTRITIGGAGPLYYPNILTNLPLGRFYLWGTDEAGGPPISILEGYDLLNHMIGENWFPDSSPQVVNYPASIGLISGSLAAPGANQAVAMGRISLDDQIRNASAGGEHVVIAALSEGTLVINSELAHLATSPDAPRSDQLSFAMFASPELGLADIYLPTGLTVPIVGYTVRGLADSQYDVSIVFHQYDAWADPPDRPWNLLADLNALMGTLYFHNNSALASPSETVTVSEVTNALGGTVTTSMIPSPTLPLLEPLRQLGFPTQTVDWLNSTLKPVVDAGYSRLTPDAGPYFSHGRLVCGSSATTIPTASRATLRKPSRRGAQVSQPAAPAVAGGASSR